MPTPLEWTTLVLGAAGTALGIVNGVRQIVSARVRLRIRSYPLIVRQTETQFESFACVEIANLGSFPVTIKEVAFKRMSIPGQSLDFRKRCLDGSRLPKRLESHDSIQVCFPHDGMPELIAQSDYVIAETACGEVRRGKLDYWRHITEQAAKAKNCVPESVVI